MRNEKAVEWYSLEKEITDVLKYGQNIKAYMEKLQRLFDRYETSGSV